MRFAGRLDQVPPYLFAEIERRIEAMRADGIDVISLGIGDPDMPDAAGRRRGDPARRWSARRRTSTPRTAGSPPSARPSPASTRDRFGVEVDPRAEVIPVLGGKEAVAHVALACLDPGDVALAPDPGYPPYTSGPVFAGAEVHYLPLPGGERVHARPRRNPGRDARRARTSSTSTTRTTRPAPSWRTGSSSAPSRSRAGTTSSAIHDSAYTEIAFDGYRPPSFLAAPGAKDVGVEIFSLSKGWNMTGWRVGWIAGNAEVVERYRSLKTNLDSGMFDALQLAGVAALTEAREFPQEMSEVYRRRRDLMIAALAESGIEAEPPRATPYLWIRVPEGHDCGELHGARARAGCGHRLAGALVRAVGRGLRADLADRPGRAAGGGRAADRVFARLTASGSGA